MKDLVFDAAKLEALCQEYQVKRLAVFGSVLRGQNTPESDLDLLVEFRPNARIGLLGFSQLERQLCEIFGRAVDLNTPGFLNRAFRGEVIQQAQSIYAG